LEVLETAFQRSHYPEVTVVDRLSNFLKLTPDRIAVWFQNRRARFKRAKKSRKPGDECDEEEESPRTLSEASMLKEVEELLFSSLGNTSFDTAAKEHTSEMNKPKKKRPGKRPEFESFSETQQDETSNSNSNYCEENDSPQPHTSSTNIDKNERVEHSSRAKSPDIILIEEVVKPKHKPIFNPMSYEPSNSVVSNVMPYSTYNPSDVFSVNNLVNHSNNNEYYSYEANMPSLKLPIYKIEKEGEEEEEEDSNDRSRASSRSFSPNQDEAHTSSNSSESSASLSMTKDDNNQNNSQFAYSNYQYANHQNGFYNQQPYNSGYYNQYPHHNPHLFQSYYNTMTENLQQNPHYSHQTNGYFPNMYSQLSSNPIPTSTYN
jgi:hypothetical protein